MLMPVFLLYNERCKKNAHEIKKWMYFCTKKKLKIQVWLQKIKKKRKFTACNLALL